MTADSILSRKPPAADERIAYGSDPNQFGDLRLPKRGAPLPLVVNIHGGFWQSRYDLNHAGHLCAALTDRGIATWNIEYRRVGQAGGGWPGTMQDVSAAFRFTSKLVTRYKLDAARTVVMGHSAGGHLALCLAASAPNVRGVVALAAVSDVRRGWELNLGDGAVAGFLGGSPSEVPEHYAEASPIELAIRVPQYIIHGAQDEIVPVEMSRSYVKRKAERGEQVKLVEIAGAGHFELIDPLTAAWQKVRSSVLELFGLSHSETRTS